jgi:hypothetical protein
MVERIYQKNQYRMHDGGVVRFEILNMIFHETLCTQISEIMSPNNSNENERRITSTVIGKGWNDAWDCCKPLLKDIIGGALGISKKFSNPYELTYRCFDIGWVHPIATFIALYWFKNGRFEKMYDQRHTDAALRDLQDYVEIFVAPLGMKMIYPLPDNQSELPEIDEDIILTICGDDEDEVKEAYEIWKVFCEAFYGSTFFYFGTVFRRD